MMRRSGSLDLADEMIPADDFDRIRLTDAPKQSARPPQEDTAPELGPAYETTAQSQAPLHEDEAPALPPIQEAYDLPEPPPAQEYDMPIDKAPEYHAQAYDSPEFPPLQAQNAPQTSAARPKREKAAKTPAQEGVKQRSVLPSLLWAGSALSSALVLRSIAKGDSEGLRVAGAALSLGGTFLFLYALMQLLTRNSGGYPKASAIIRGGSLAVLSFSTIITLNQWTTPLPAPAPAKQAEVPAVHAAAAPEAEIAKLRADLQADLQTRLKEPEANIEAIRKELNAFIAANDQRLRQLETERLRAAGTPGKPADAHAPEPLSERARAETPKPKDPAAQGESALKAGYRLKADAAEADPAASDSVLTAALSAFKEAETAFAAAALPGKLAESRLRQAELITERGKQTEAAAKDACATPRTDGSVFAQADELFMLASSPEARKAAPFTAASALNGSGVARFRAGAYLTALESYDEAVKMFRALNLPAEAGMTENNRGNTLSLLAHCAQGANAKAYVEQALTAYRKAAEAFALSGKYEEFALTKTNAGKLYEKLGDHAPETERADYYAKARDAYETALKLSAGAPVNAEERRRAESALAELTHKTAQTGAVPGPKADVKEAAPAAHPPFKQGDAHDSAPSSAAPGKSAVAKVSARQFTAAPETAGH